MSAPAAEDQAVDGQELHEDVSAMAEHVLRTRDIDFGYGRYHGLDEHAARRAVRALAAAGLLRARPRHDLPVELTADRAELLVHRGLADRQDTIVVAEAGVLRLTWCTSIRGYRLTDHTGEHFRGSDDAAAAFNELARRAVTAADADGTSR
ncbi:hypothetical protein [Amycolatopsis sp. NPDC004378]